MGTDGLRSTSQMVANHLDEDIVLRESLARGVVNFRALARWLSRTYDWRVPEETLVTAIRRYLERGNPSLFATPRKLLARAHVNVRGGMCSIAPEGASAIYESFGQLVAIPDFARGERLHLITGERGVKLIFDERNLPRVVKALGERGSTEARRGLTEISVFLPPEARNTPGVLAYLANALTLHGINIEESADAVSQFMFFVRSGDAITAHQTLSGLTARDPAPPGAVARGGHAGDQS